MRHLDNGPIVAFGLLSLLLGYASVDAVAVANRQDAPTATASSSSDPLAGRLGGPRGSFEAAYGEPVLFLGEDQVGFAVEDFGRAIVSFSDQRANRIVLIPEGRPLDRPSTDPDPADWPLATARQAVRRFLPTDAALTAEPSGASEGQTTGTGQSAALALALDPLAVDTCPDVTAPTFRYDFTMPTAETVSAITIDVAEPARGGAAPDPSSASTVVGEGTGGRISVGQNGTVTINGLRLRLLGIDRDPEVATEPAGSSALAIELSVENLSDEPVRFSLAGVRLIDATGEETERLCGGAEPILTSGELEPGEVARGWVTFPLPETAEPERLVFRVGGSDGISVTFSLT